MGGPEQSHSKIARDTFRDSSAARPSTLPKPALTRLATNNRTVGFTLHSIGYAGLHPCSTVSPTQFINPFTQPTTLFAVRVMAVHDLEPIQVVVGDI